MNTERRDFDAAVAEVFDRVMETLDASGLECTCETGEGLLCIEWSKGDQTVLSRHGPSEELWLADRSGGFHFRLTSSGWRDTRSNTPLSEVLSRLSERATGVRLSFEL
ncbi:MAG: iron donor protein CyaY [Casimicrobiaceae bacterium]|nr:iron donor protein CyaY [Casimicrobiaceae bacterium]